MVEKSIEEGSMGSEELTLRTSLSLALASWGLFYAAYRGYYAAGGTLGIPGTPVSESEFRSVNLVGAVVIAAWALFPLAALPLWSRPRVRPVLLAVFWLGAVFLCMHALVDMTERVLSLAGVIEIDYPDSFWASHDGLSADLQDLLFNEPWFLVDGLGAAALAWISSAPGGHRRRWALVGVAVTCAFWAVGLLSVTHVIGKAIVG